MIHVATRHSTMLASADLKASLPPGNASQHRPRPVFIQTIVGFPAYLRPRLMPLVYYGARHFFLSTHSKSTYFLHVCLFVRLHLLHVASWHNTAPGAAHMSRCLLSNTCLFLYEQPLVLVRVSLSRYSAYFDFLYLKSFPPSQKKDVPGIFNICCHTRSTAPVLTSVCVSDTVFHVANRHNPTPGSAQISRSLSPKNVSQHRPVFMRTVADRRAAGCIVRA